MQEVRDNLLAICGQLIAGSGKAARFTPAHYRAIDIAAGWLTSGNTWGLKIMGGIGICGRPLCCHSYLSEFIPVSIKMAKEQNLSLNPTKISGVCGRLMCCLKNEEETYEVLNSKLPGIGDTVTTADGLRGEVHSVNVLRQTVKVIVVVDKDEKEIREYKVDQLKFKPRRKKGKGGEKQDEAELKKLEALEKREGKSRLNDK